MVDRDLLRLSVVGDTPERAVRRGGSHSEVIRTELIRSELFPSMPIVLLLMVSDTAAFYPLCP